MSAVRYASPYSGAGRAGYVYTTSTAHSHSASLGMAQSPVASMGSTSAYIGRGVSTTMAVSTPAVTGFTTAASAIRGGVMASATYARMGVVKREPGHPPAPDECPYCHDDNGDGVCDRCGCAMDDCTCEDESGYCWCPIDGDWKVWLFMAAIAAAYAASKRKAAVI